MGRKLTDAQWRRDFVMKVWSADVIMRGISARWYVLHGAEIISCHGTRLEAEAARRDRAALAARAERVARRLGLKQRVAESDERGE